MWLPQIKAGKGISAKDPAAHSVFHGALVDSKDFGLNRQVLQGAMDQALQENVDSVYQIPSCLSVVFFP